MLNLRPIVIIVVVATAATVARAQVATTVAPQIVPVGCSMMIGISNDTATSFPVATAMIPVMVFDAAGNQVAFFTSVTQEIVPLAPGGSRVLYQWAPNDAFGNALPFGNYTMDIDLYGNIETHAFSIADIDASLGSIGVHRRGTTRRLYLCSPQDPGGIYFLAASFSASNGIPTCGGVFPLDNDPLFMLSRTQGNGVFLDTVGLLDPAMTSVPGTTTIPAIAIPDAPFVTGIAFAMAFAVVDPTATCSVVRISVPEIITIQ